VSTATALDRFASLQLPGVRIGALPVEPVRRLPTGIESLDELLGGGLPRGHLSEIVGGPSSGRTALLHALLASATQRGEVVAVVDLPDALDPRSLAQAGADLTRVLWVRPPSPQVALKCAELILSAGGFGMLAVDGLGARAPRAGRALPPHVWPRLAQVTRRAGAVCLLCVPQRIAGGAAATALLLTQHRVQWSGRLFAGVSATAVLSRSRFSPAERAIELMLGDRLGGYEGVKFERGGVLVRPPLPDLPSQRGGEGRWRTVGEGRGAGEAVGKRAMG
jgi:hypothetical protein